VVEAEVEEAGVDVVDVVEAVEEASLLLTLPLLAVAVGKRAARFYKRSRSLSTSFIGSDALFHVSLAWVKIPQ
jgi:hypothetical protein